MTAEAEISSPEHITPEHLIRLWDEHEDAGVEFFLEVPVKIKTKAIAKGEFTCPFEIRNMAYEVDNPNSVQLQVCGVFVPWDPVQQLFCNERYCFRIEDMQLNSTLKQ